MDLDYAIVYNPRCFVMDLVTFCNKYLYIIIFMCRELQGLVTEGRGVIAQTVNRHQQLIYANAHTLQSGLQELEAQAKGALREQLDCIHSEFDSSAALLSVLEQVALADSELVTILCNAVAATSADAAAGTGKHGGGGGRDAKKAPEVIPAGDATQSKRVLFQAVSSNTADYQMLASSISPVSATLPAEAQVTKKKAGRNAPAVVSQGSEANRNARAALDQLEVARLYKVAMQPALGFGSTTGAN